MIIYKATAKHNNKIYIGKTTRLLKRRIQEHVWNAEKKNTWFNNTIRKYGCEGFDWEIIGTANSVVELNQLEIRFIEISNSMYPHGFNLRTGGEGGLGSHKISEATKIKMSQAKLGKRRPPFTDEHKQKISNKQKKNFLIKKLCQVILQYQTKD